MDRRNEPRHPLTCYVEPIASPGQRQRHATTPMPQATVVNVSTGGVCLLFEEPVEPFSIMPCRFRFPSVPVSVPVLMEVRWIAPLTPGAGVFRIGLAFLC